MSKTKSKIKNKKLSPRQVRREIIRFFDRNNGKQYNAKQILSKLKIANNKDSVSHAMHELVAQGKLIPGKGDKFKMKKNTGKRSSEIHQGTVDLTKSGAAYIVTDTLEDDIYVSSKNVNGALHGDKVKVSVYSSRRRKPEGEIVEVIERAQDFFLGTIRIWKNHAVVTPTHRGVPMDIHVPLEHIMSAADGDKVVIKVTNWPTQRSHSIMGRVTSVLGAENSNELAMKSILINNGFELDFPELALKEAEALPSQINEAEAFRRRDMRHITTFTIDPEDAKDFDDALSFRTIDDGCCEVGIHIADVTHYVKQGTPLDQEAYKRSTSVYLVDRVLPMLPEVLSNELCSLRPNEDKCTFSAVFVLDADYKIQSRWFGKTLIHSDKRFSYQDAQKVMDAGKGEFSNSLMPLLNISRHLRKKRFGEGSIAFESDEIRFRLDEDGKPLSVFRKERIEAHLLIEEFMLLANREVATFIQNKGKDHEIPFVYRIHDSPDPDRLAEFAAFAKQMGVNIDTATPRSISNSLNKLAKMAQENESLKMLEPMAIRTMAKAVYSSENIGHYGLAFTNYSHFTSPIRRYADVLVHRLLERNLSGTYRERKDRLEEMCKHISSQERRAVQAERESVKYKQVEFMQNQVGNTFEGYISGFIDRGFFVALKESLAEGLIAFSNMDDHYQLEGSRLMAKAVNSGVKLHMGDLVVVRILSVDLDKREIDMGFIKMLNK